jgi:hypothetical protein
MSHLALRAAVDRGLPSLIGLFERRRFFTELATDKLDGPAQSPLCTGLGPSERLACSKAVFDPLMAGCCL